MGGGGGGGVVTIYVSGYGLFITTSAARDPSAPGTPNVYPPRSAKEYEEHLDAVESHLGSIGLRVDLREALLSRVDLFKDIVVEAEYGDRAHVLQACGLQRLSPLDLKNSLPFGEEVGKNSRKALKAHTYGYLRSRRADVFYSKLVHLGQLKGSEEYATQVARLIGGKDVLRFESRFLNADAVRKGKLKLKYVKDLISSWDSLDTKFSELVDERLSLKAGTRGITDPGISLSSRLETVTTEKGKGKTALILSLASMQVDEILQERGTSDLEFLHAVARDCDMRTRDIQAALEDLLPFISAEGSTTSIDLLNDIRDRLHSDPFEWPAL